MDGDKAEVVSVSVNVVDAPPTVEPEKPITGRMTTRELRRAWGLDENTGRPHGSGLPPITVADLDAPLPSPPRRKHMEMEVDVASKLLDKHLLTTPLRLKPGVEGPITAATLPANRRSMRGSTAHDGRRPALCAEVIEQDAPVIKGIFDTIGDARRAGAKGFRYGVFGSGMVRGRRRRDEKGGPEASDGEPAGGEPATKRSNPSPTEQPPTDGRYRWLPLVRAPMYKRDALPGGKAANKVVRARGTTLPKGHLVLQLGAMFGASIVRCAEPNSDRLADTAGGPWEMHPARFGDRLYNSVTVDMTRTEHVAVHLEWSMCDDEGDTIRNAISHNVPWPAFAQWMHTGVPYSGLVAAVGRYIY